MLLLATVTSISVVVAGAVSVLEGQPGPRPQPMKPVHVADQGPASEVRVIGTPFVPNTNPRDR